jgi:uncharacterized membrane protein
MRASANIGGHPIHPALIPFPIGLWVFSFVADLIFLWRGNPLWEEYIAFYTLLAGIIGAVLAAVFGMIDRLGMKETDAVPTANLHMGLNVVALLVFVVSFYLRTTSGMHMTGGSFKIPFVLSLIGIILIAISGYLGGELVFRYGVGVEARPEGSPEA